MLIANRKSIKQWKFLWVWILATNEVTENTKTFCFPASFHAHRGRQIKSPRSRCYNTGRDFSFQLGGLASDGKAVRKRQFDRLITNQQSLLSLFIWQVIFFAYFWEISAIYMLCKDEKSTSVCQVAKLRPTWYTLREWFDVDVAAVCLYYTSLMGVEMNIGK